MNIFHNMKVSTKLGVLIFIALVSLGIVGGIGYYYLQDSSTDMNTLYADRLVPVKLIIESRSHANATNAEVLELLLTTDPKRKQELRAGIDDHMRKNNENMAGIEKVHLDSKAAELLAKVKEARQKNREVRAQVLELALQNKNAEAYALYANSLAPLTEKYTDSLRDLANYLSKISEEMNAINQADYQQATRITIGIIVAALVLLCISGWFISRMITKPLQILVSACEELAAGDFRDKPRHITSKDEIGQVADALVNMRSSVRAVLKKVSESAEQVAASSEELTASASQSAQAVTHIAVSVNDVAQGAEMQLNAVDETTAIVEQMSAGIQQVAAGANQAAANSFQAAEKAREGDMSVEKAVSQMTNIEQTVNNSAQVVAKLGERSKEIGQIVDTISGIAGQTNLLALNAAIEAARAGEQGRGFAVVAEEVRKLAEQSQDAAKQIASLIREIQGDTDKAVVAMSEGTREVKVGTEVVTSAGQAFKEIAALVMQVSEQVRESSAAMQQMASGSQQIVSSVKQIDRLSKAAVEKAQTVSAATEEQSASMEEIEASSQSLARLAQDLKAAVDHFQI